MFHDTDLFDIPHSHETDNEAGWMYRDEPYGGFLVYDYGECFTTHKRNKFEIPFAVTVEFINLEDACGEEGFLVEGHLTPLPDILSEEKLHTVAGMWDTDGNPVVTVHDVASYGLCAPIENEWGAESWEAGFEAIRNALTFHGNLPGWLLDRPWNMIGTTGWDLFHDAVFDEDAFEKSLNRARKRIGMDQEAA